MDQYKQTDEIFVKVSVRNSGRYDGDEVVQLYVRDSESSKPVPIRSLKGFKRISLKAGETRQVSFIIPVKNLGYWVSEDHAFEVEPGNFIIEAAASSADIRLSKNILVK
jgi:beta-glucosidase